MRIGVNVLAIKPNTSGGIEYYIYNLIRALAKMDSRNEYILFVSRDNYDTINHCNTNIKKISINVKSNQMIKRIFLEQIYLPILARQFRIDVLHSPTYTWPVLANVPGVVTVCDMLYKILPDAIRPVKILFWRLFIPISIFRCRRVLTLSENSKRDIIRFLNVRGDKISVSPLALDIELTKRNNPSEREIERVCKKYSLKRPYFLNVGGMGKHKNPIMLVHCLKKMKKRLELEDISLVITGKDYGSRKDVEEAAAALDLQKNVFLPGYVDREDLPGIYAGAFAYVSPSYHEGFGLTILEAMSFGTPVVISDRSALPEVARNAAEYINPNDPTQLAESLYRIKTFPGLRNEMINRGYERLKDFSWEKCARITMEAYEQAGKRI